MQHLYSRIKPIAFFCLQFSAILPLCHFSYRGICYNIDVWVDSPVTWRWIDVITLFSCFHFDVIPTFQQVIYLKLKGAKRNKIKLSRELFCFAHWLSDWLTHSLTDLFTDWLNDSMTDWFTDCIDSIQRKTVNVLAFTWTKVLNKWRTCIKERGKKRASSQGQTIIKNSTNALARKKQLYQLFLNTQQIFS